MEILGYLITLTVGFIAGALVTRNNLDEVNAVVREAKDLAEAADAKLDEIRENTQKKPRATKKTRTTK